MGGWKRWNALRVVIKAKKYRCGQEVDVSLLHVTFTGQLQEGLACYSINSVGTRSRLRIANVAGLDDDKRSNVAVQQ